MPLRTAGTGKRVLFPLILIALLPVSAAANICPDPDDSRCAGPPTDLSEQRNASYSDLDSAAGQW